MDGRESFICSNCLSMEKIKEMLKYLFLEKNAKKRPLKWVEGAWRGRIWVFILQHMKQRPIIADLKKD